jgi:hypothetical protein
MYRSYYHLNLTTESIYRVVATLVKGGMTMEHAVNLVASTYGLQLDTVHAAVQYRGGNGHAVR